MSDQIRETIFTITVLHEKDENPLNMDIKEVLEEMYDGTMIGQVNFERQDDVPEQELHDRLLAIGNDGTFFGEY